MKMEKLMAEYPVAKEIFTGIGKAMITGIGINLARIFFKLTVDKWLEPSSSPYKK